MLFSVRRRFFSGRKSSSSSWSQLEAWNFWERREAKDSFLGRCDGKDSTGKKRRHMCSKTLLRCVLGPLLYDYNCSPCSATDAPGSFFPLQGEWVSSITAGPPADAAAVVLLLLWHAHRQLFFSLTGTVWSPHFLFNWLLPSVELPCSASFAVMLQWRHNNRHTTIWISWKNRYHPACSLWSKWSYWAERVASPGLSTAGPSFFHFL